MQKDIALKQLAEHEDVFAEIFNQLAFYGKQIVKPDQLISIPTEAFVKETEGLLREGFHKIRHWKETLTALSAIEGDRRYKQMVNVWEEHTQNGKGEGEESMCEVLDEIFNDGKEEGLKEGLKEGIGALIEACRELGALREDTLQRILRKFNLPQQQAEEYMVIYW